MALISKQHLQPFHRMSDLDLILPMLQALETSYTKLKFKSIERVALCDGAIMYSSPSKRSHRHKVTCRGILRTNIGGYDAY